MGVGGPFLPCVFSMYVLMSFSRLPSSISFITSRVMSMQICQPTLIGSNSGFSTGDLSFT